MTEETKVPEKVKTPKKAPAKKEKDPCKVFAEQIADILLRPTRRRMTFLYPALCRPAEGILVLGTNPKQIVFGNPEEGLALVRIKDTDWFTKFWNWLILQGIDQHRIEAVDLGKLIAGLGRIKNDFTQIITYRSGDDEELWVQGSEKQAASTAIYSLFTMNRFAYQVEQFIPAMNGTVAGFDYPVDVIKDVPKIQRFVIPKEQFRQTSLGNVYDSDIRLMASRGYDLLCASQFTDIQVKYHGFRFWPVSGNTIYYASVIDTDMFTFLAARCNVFLIPV